MSINAALNKISQIIQNNVDPDTKNIDGLFGQLYPAIREIAQRELGKLNPGQQVSATMLVNECYLKLKISQPKQFQNQKHFYNTVARCMRFYLIDLVRKHFRLKRQGIHTELQVSQVVGDPDITVQLLELNDVLDQLEQIDPELAHITQLRYFVGMTLQEIAEIYQTNTNHIFKQWKIAQSYLINLLEDLPSE